MFTHGQIWNALDKLAESRGFSSSGLARQAGLDPTSFNKSKRNSPEGKPRWPSTESLSKVLDVTGANLHDLMTMIEEDAPQSLSTEIRKKMAHDTARALIETKSVLFNPKEPYTLKSGRKSPCYIDCRRLISFVRERDTLMDHAARLLSADIGAENLDLMAGGETAGIPYGAYISDRMQKPMVYVRKEPKGYGRMAQIEGYMPEAVDGKKPNVILIEDLQTDGGSKEIFIKALRDAGAVVEHAFVVFHYGIFPQSEENMKKAGVQLHALATWWDVLEVAKEHDYFDADTLASVEAFLHNPLEWEA